MRKGTIHTGLSDRCRENFKRLRAKREIGQVALAKKMGISKGYVSMLETGERHFTTNMIEAACKAFGVSFGEMIK